MARARSGPAFPVVPRRKAWDVWTFGGFRIVRCTWCGAQVVHQDTPANLTLQAVWSETHERECSERLLRASQVTS